MTVNSDLSGSFKSTHHHAISHVIARSEATWQSASPKNITITVLFRIGERIATPVCALARNDVDVMMVHTEQPDKSEFASPAILCTVGAEVAEKQNGVQYNKLILAF